MASLSPDLIVFSILFTLLLVWLLGMLWTWAWALGQIGRGRPLLASVCPLPLRQAPWGAMTVFSVFVLYLLVNYYVTRSYEAATGRHLPRALKPAEKRDDPTKLEKADAENRRGEKPPKPVDAARPGQGKGWVAGDPDGGPAAPAEQTQSELMLQLAVINSLLLVLVPAVVRLTSGASLADLGLSLNDWRRQMIVGVRAAMLVTPAVYAVQSLAVHIWQSQKHPVEQMILEKFAVGAAILAVLSTMVLAPMIEELLFRAIVQLWLNRLVSAQPSPAGIEQVEFRSEGSRDVRPWYFEDAVTPQVAGSSIERGGHQRAELKPPRLSALPIVLTSLFFAVLHLPQWPAPIAIFPLSMALGAVYQRTGSLIAAITMHGTFNGFSTLLLLLVAYSRQLQPPKHPPADVSSGVEFLTHLLSAMGIGLGSMG
jgi:membrane protease YdiL (CAAX protease family)